MDLTILAVDDTKKILDIIRHFLENEGYRVITTPDPFEGLRIAQEEKIDLLLLDIMMPGMDGYTLCDQLKQNPKTRDMPVVMLTAKAVIMHTPKDFFYGLYGFLSKPFSKQQLLRIVNDILAMTQTDKETRFLKPLEDDTEEEIEM